MVQHHAYAGYVEAGVAAKYQFTEHVYLKAEVDYFQGIAYSAKSTYGGNSDNKVVGTVGLGFSF
jgi:hypothetical protein